MIAKEPEVPDGSCIPSKVSLAPAKVNLSLHIVGRRTDGYHLLESLTVFARQELQSPSCDVLHLTPGPMTELVVDGPTAAHAGRIEDNLVLKTARLFRDNTGKNKTGQFHLTKRLPTAAGLGGGSADAAAALRLLAGLNGMETESPQILAAARLSGSDVPVCLSSVARLMAGTGERLGGALALPPLDAVLVNPRVAVDTRDVFLAAGYEPGISLADAAHPPIPKHLRQNDLFELLQTVRNDLEPAARSIAPIIGEALGLVRATRHCALARMSGSGATVFGLYPDTRAAFLASEVLRAARPQWWIEQTVLS